MWLLDVRPDPVPISGIAGLILLVIVVFIITATLIVGFVFLLKRLKRRQTNEPAPASGSPTQPSSPNQR